MAIGDHDLHTLAGAYVLDAVTGSERAAFAEHLAGCEQCRQEIREFREATARLGAAAAVDPRPEFKGAAMAAAGRIIQQAPSGRAGRSPTAGPSRANPGFGAGSGAGGRRLARCCRSWRSPRR
jgi:anti-sigma factor RsiW